MEGGPCWRTKRRFRESSARVMTSLKQRNEVSTFLLLPWMFVINTWLLVSFKSHIMFTLASFSKHTCRVNVPLPSTVHDASLIWVSKTNSACNFKAFWVNVQDTTICDHSLDQKMRQFQRSIQPFVLATQRTRQRSWWTLRHNCQSSTKPLPTSIRPSFSVCSYKAGGWDIMFAILTLVDPLDMLTGIREVSNKHIL